jgi:hypothetical protein
MGILLSGATLYWRWLAIAGLCAALFISGAVWEGKRAEARLEAYKAAVDAAADKQAIHAGIVRLEGVKTLETVTGGLNNELSSIAARYALYRQANPACYDRPDGCGVRPVTAKVDSSGLPTPAARVPGDAQDPTEQRFIAALGECEESEAQLRAWQKWYSENTKNFSLPSSLSAQ